MSVLERVAEARGRLLKAERFRTASLGLCLTFDVGRVWLRPGGSQGPPLVQTVDATDTLPGDVEDACEEDPWWRLLGNELTRVKAPEADGAVRLQFRADDANPRVVRIGSDGASDGLTVTLEATAH